MQTQNNNIINTLLQLRVNNKISKLEAVGLWEVLKSENNKVYVFLFSKLQTMLIPPENIIRLISEVKGDDTLWGKAFKLMNEGNIECALWFKTVEPLEFDFDSLINDIHLHDLEKMYKIQCDMVKYSKMTEEEKNKAYEDVFKTYTTALTEINNRLKKQVEEKEREKMARANLSTPQDMMLS